VPLTAPVLELLERRRFGADERYVFSNHRHTCVCQAKKAASILSKGLSFEFRAHELRRTVAPFIGDAGGPFPYRARVEPPKCDAQHSHGDL
jgi:hypothetical protein